MKKIKFFVPILFLLITSCGQEKKSPSTPEQQTNNEIKYPKTGKFYDISDTNSLVIAAPIIYDVVVKNTNPADEWTEFCLENINIQAFSNIIFNAVYQKKLIPYNYKNDTIITLEEIKKFEKENKAQNIGKIQFEEKWYFDETNLRMSKKVKYIIFGYEMINENNQVYGYKPGFKVYLDKEHNVQENAISK